MYEAHFGLRSAPFRLSPDADFYFDSRGHHAAAQSLRHGLAARRGHLLVSGEIGAGKTLLVASVLGELDESRDAVARLVSTQLDGDGLVRAVLASFGCERREPDPGADPLRDLEAFLGSLSHAGRRAVLLIDEAQNLEPGAWARLDEIIGLHGAGGGRFTLCLVGQPELREIVAAPRLAGLRARLVVECHLEPLGAMETGAYISHRLQRVGWSGRPAFGADALDRVHHWTGGIPRRINQLCNRLLLSAFLAQREQIDALLVDLTAEELLAEIGEGAIAARPFETAAALPDRPDALRPSPAPVSPPESEDEDEEVEPISLTLRAIDDLVPARPDYVVPEPLAPPVPAARVRFPAFAPWPELPAAPVAPVAPPVLNEVLEPSERGQLLCFAASVSDHAHAAALLRAFASHHKLPTARLVRAFGNDALTLTQGLFRPEDARRAIALDVSPAGSYAEQASELLVRFEALLTKTRPLAVVVFDGYLAGVAASTVAARRDVPVFRVGGGAPPPDFGARESANGARREPLPELLYASDASVAQEWNRQQLPADRRSVVGSVVADALRLALECMPRVVGDASVALEGIAARIASERAGYGVVTLESRANLQDRHTLGEIVAMLAECSRDLPLLWPMRDSTREQLLHLHLDSVIDRARIVCLPVQPYATFARLLADATCVFADSWTVQQEATALEVPCLAIGVVPPQPLALAEGSVIAVGTGRAAATRAVWDCVFVGGHPKVPPRLWDGHAAERIATHLSGYLTRFRAGR